MATDIHSMKLNDVVVLTALLHDCGKILSFSEGESIEDINMKKNNGQTSCPGHEYWGGKIVVPEILNEIDIPHGVKKFISECVKVHDTFSKPYFDPKKDWTIQEIIYDIKSRANGYYEEALFNIYCDCNASPAFVEGIALIREIFNEPSFYIKRKYLLP